MAHAATRGYQFENLRERVEDTRTVNAKRGNGGRGRAGRRDDSRCFGRNAVDRRHHGRGQDGFGRDGRGDRGDGWEHPEARAGAAVLSVTGAGRGVSRDAGGDGRLLAGGEIPPVGRNYKRSSGCGRCVCDGAGQAGHDNGGNDGAGICHGRPIKDCVSLQWSQPSTVSRLGNLRRGSCSGTRPGQEVGLTASFSGGNSMQGLRCSRRDGRC